VPDRADVDVRLAAIKLFLCHFELAFCRDLLQELLEPLTRIELAARKSYGAVDQD
jgi:hypothetical protein